MREDALVAAQAVDPRGGLVAGGGLQRVVGDAQAAQGADVLAQGQLAVDVLVGVVGQRRIAVELGDQLVGACLEAGAVFLRPPVDVVAGAVELAALVVEAVPGLVRSEEHTSELQSLMRISYAVFCLKKKKSNKKYVKINIRE